MDIHSSSPSLDHISLPRSTILETKNKFDSFLKAALKEPTSKNVSNKSNTHKTSATISEYAYEGENKIKTSAHENREFILNKFFEGNFQSSTLNTVITPIPKPRTKIQRKSHKDGTLSPAESDETFKVTSPKLVSMVPENVEVILDYEENSDEKNDKMDYILSPVSSAETFRVNSPRILKPPAELFSCEKETVIPEDKSYYKIKKSDNSPSRLQEDNNEDLASAHCSETPRFPEIGAHEIYDSKEEVVEISNENRKYDKINIENENVTEQNFFCNVMHLIIHKTDKLQLNSFVIHPVVKIHIVDINTGNYYPKKHKKRPVMYYYDHNLNYIPPIMTQPFNLQEQRSLLPMWEETILINEDFNYLATEKENIIIFFEILDFMSLSTLKDRTKGWHKIAFAFLKMGKNHSINLEKIMRLQLYYSSPKKDDPQRCSAWDRYHKKKLYKYPSTLYITINKVKCKIKKLTGIRSKNAMQEEIGTENVEMNNSDKNSDDDSQKINISPLVHIIEKNIEGRKSVDDVIKLPNNCLAQFQTEEGCFTLKFSHNGLFLACSLKVDEIYSIVIFSAVSFEKICHFPSHQGIVYSITWSSDDSLLTAASADSSVSVWDVLKMSFLQILPHPYFVYTSDVNQKFIVTGCYDAVVRLWKNESVIADFVLNQELKGHDGYITCVLFKNNYSSILSADSMGVIVEWILEFNSWGLSRKISIPDLKGIIINQIDLIGKEKRLVVHSRDSILRILDLKTLIVIHWLHGGLNRRFHTACSISPCEHFIIAGSENSLINIWDVKNGKYIGNLIPFDNKAVLTIHTLSFHPKKNMLAVGHFGNALPVLLFGYYKENKNITINSELVQGQKTTTRKNVRILKYKDNHNEGDVDEIDLNHVLNKFEKLMSGQLK